MTGRHRAHHLPLWARLLNRVRAWAGQRLTPAPGDAALPHTYEEASR